MAPPDEANLGYKLVGEFGFVSTCTYIRGGLFFFFSPSTPLVLWKGYSLYDVGNVWSHFLEISSGLFGPQDAVC